MTGGAAIHISGIVQGVGFRPFVYNLASRFGLAGWVRNTSGGVDIVVEGPLETLELFVQALHDEAPPLSRIDEFIVSYGPLNGFEGFEILHSEAIPDAFQPISPDVAICADCLRELYDPQDRRSNTLDAGGSDGRPAGCGLRRFATRKAGRSKPCAEGSVDVDPY